MAKKEVKKVSFIPLMDFIMGKPIKKKKPKPKQEIKLKEEPKPKINNPEGIIESKPKVIRSLVNHWYDWKADKCPNCSGKERISIPEYPTQVCKKCWEDKCKFCASVISIDSEGKCWVCEN